MAKPKAFTLIELLVVIGVIALLLAILIPALQGASRQAKAAVCQSNLSQWRLMFSMYAGDNNGKFFGYVWSEDTWLLWMDALEPYYRDCNDIILCPMAVKYRQQPPFPSWVGGKYSAWYWAGSLWHGLSGSYGLNNWVQDDNGCPYAAIDNAWFWKTTLAKGGANVPVFLDGSCSAASPQAGDEPPAEDGVPNFSTDLSVGNHMSLFCIDRHNGSINGLFMDWSVRKVGLKELWTLKWHRQFDTANEWTRAGGVQPEDWPQWMRKFKDY